MKKLAQIRKIFSLFILISLTSFSGYVSAGHIECSSYVEDKVSPIIDCGLGHDSQDFLHDPLQVNLDTMFTFNDWSYDFKIDDLENEAAMQGSFSFGSNWDDFDQVMAVFKSGASDNTDPNQYVGYLLDLSDDQTIYTWSSMFVNSMNDNPKGVSHISFYVRDCLNEDPFCDFVDTTGGGDPIPEPQSLLILSAGLLGIFINRRKLFK